MPYCLISVISTIKEWQELIAGVIGFGGAVAAIWYTAVSEKHKNAKDAKALRQALGVELRDMAFNTLRKIIVLQPAGEGSLSITSRELATLVCFVDPIIYKQSAARIAVVGQYAYAVVSFYSQLEYCTDGVRQLRADNAEVDFKVSDDERRSVVIALASALRNAKLAMLNLEPIDANSEAKTKEFVTAVDKAFAERGIEEVP